MTSRLLPHCTLAIAAICANAGYADALDDYVASRMADLHTPSLAIAVLRDGQTLKIAAYGQSNLELETPASVDTVYQLASVTKPFTAVGIMKLVEDGSVRLEDKISVYFDEIPPSWEEITVGHLISHTSGIKDYINEKLLDPRRAYSNWQIVDEAKSQPLLFSPGQGWAYSNTNFLLLGMLIEKQSGKRYEHFLKDCFFGPLGMASSGRRDLSRICPMRAAAYEWNGREFSNSRYLERSQWDNADGGLVASIADLARFETALSGGKILPPRLLEQMWQPFRLSNGRIASYGLGWECEDVRGHRRVGHGGGRSGVSTYFARYVEHGITIIALANCSGVDVKTEIIEAVAGHYIPDLQPLHLREQVLDDDPATRERLLLFLHDVAAGNTDSKLVTAANRQIVSNPQRRLAKMLSASKGFHFLGAEETKDRGLLRNGDKIAQLRHYRLLTDDVTQYLTFYLTEQSLIADQEGDERSAVRGNAKQPEASP